MVQAMIVSLQTVGAYVQSGKLCACGGDELGALEAFPDVQPSRNWALGIWKSIPGTACSRRPETNRPSL